MTKALLLTASSVILAGQLSPWNVSAHEIIVHMQISTHAAKNSDGLTNFIFDTSGLSPADPFSSGPNPIQWIEEGSAREDDINKDPGRARSFAHFYDPISRAGLSDLPPPFPSMQLGPNSFFWASRRDAPGFGSFLQIPEAKNQWSWQNTRDFQYEGLTKQSTPEREASLAKMYRGLGQVIHLLQDASQPQHVRNEQHLDKIPVIRLGSPWNSPIERYGKQNLPSLNFSPTPKALDWRTAGFTKMEDFWDRHLYVTGVTPSFQALNANETPTPTTSTLGLAEYCSGNFLGARHRYREEMIPGTLGYYAYPTQEATDWLQIKADPATYKTIGTVPRHNFGNINRFNITKMDHGTWIVNHSASHYLAARGRNMAGVAPRLTIDDPDVLKEYHDILIPKAVQFSAGLLDYFFRGRFETAWISASAPEKSALRIANKSGQDLRGGTFELFYDNASGTRAKIEPPDFTTTYTDTLADDSEVEAEFTTPIGPITSYTLVYKGTLVKDGTSEDPVDKDIAIAAKRITCIEGPGDPIQNDLLPGNLCGFAFETLTVANFSELLPKLAPCATCAEGSPLPQWDGTIQRDPGVGPCQDGGLQWLLATQNFQPIVSLGGSAIKAVVFPVLSGWEMEIVCRGQGLSWHMLWKGHKRKGYSPRGGYIVSVNEISVPDPGCAADAISCIALE